MGVSIIIPSRNEKYLSHTISDVLIKASGDIEVIAILDGYWPPTCEILQDKRVKYIHFTESRGMRNAINSGIHIARNDFILKTDAHCLFSPGYDVQLINDQKKYLSDSTITVPRRYALDPDKWEIIDNPKYPIDYMYLSKDLHGETWTTRNRDVTLAYKKIDDLMSSQGSCWFMKRDYFINGIGGLDSDTYGTFYNEFQEIGFKTWLSGGRVVVNKSLHYAHWHKPKEVGRGYKLADQEQQKTIDAIEKFRDPKYKGFKRQIHSLQWLVDKFSPVPTWTT